MRRLSLLLCCAWPLASGCSFAANIRQNLVFSPLYAASEKVDHHRHMQMGREAFAEMAASFPDYEYSCDYRRGFVEGFADYLDYGGVGEPPPIPPSSYHLASYETPAGLAMMEDWTVGFRHGAATAKASGLRCLVTIPVFDGPKYATTVAVDAQQPAKRKTDPTTVPLPTPRPVETPAGPPMSDPQPR